MALLQGPPICTFTFDVLWIRVFWHPYHQRMYTTVYYNNRRHIDIDLLHDIIRVDSSSVHRDIVDMPDRTPYHSRCHRCRLPEYLLVRSGNLPLGANWILRLLGDLMLNHGFAGAVYLPDLF